MKEKFEIKFLTQLPPKDYDQADYDYKFWELILSKPNEDYGKTISTDDVTKDKYCLLYHGEINGSHLAMQRFSRLQRYIELRKNVPIESVFVDMDDKISPEVINQYAETYSKNLISAFPANEEVRQGLKDVFQNLGCIYLLEKDTGNVIYIIDPQKHPLETLGQRVMYIISKHEDIKLSRDIIVKNLDVRRGKEDKIAFKPGTY